MQDVAPLFGDVIVRMGLVTRGQVEEALSLQTLTGQRVGEALIALGYVSREQLQTALFEALGLPKGDGVARPRLGELLMGLKHLTAQQLEEGLVLHKKQGRRLGEVLVERGFCSYRQLYEGLALQQRMVVTPAPSLAAFTAPLKARVLVVDDSSLACQLVDEGLTALGYEVCSYQDPFEGLEQVFRLKPDIVLSDLDMPGLDGAELCRRLKSGPARSVPVIILTANDADAQRVGGLRAGAEDYVRKGTSMEELAARIDAIIRRTGETERMRKLFARYTSDEVVEEVLKSGALVLTGEKREVTVLFADIRNFTALAETLPPEQVVSALNSVLGKLADAVLTCGGTLDKFLGDGLMAVFGAPVRRDDDALRALQAAQMMMDVLKEAQAGQPELRDGRLEKTAMELPLGIGINSGMVVAGNLGSDKRVEYTCIGDAVNVAARLCAIAGPWEVLVGERTRELLGDYGGFEALAPVRLKGKAQPVPLFRATWGAARS